MAAGPLIWTTDPGALAGLVRGGTQQRITAFPSITPSNQQWNKGASSSGASAISPSMASDTSPPIGSGSISPMGMSSSLQQVAGMMAQTASQTPQTASTPPVQTFDQLHPNGTPSGKNYVDPRFSSPSFIGGGAVPDDQSHGANVDAQLVARSKAQAGSAAPAPTAPKPSKPSRPTGGGFHGGGGGYRPPWRWW